jgi:hypothetical protein
VQTKKCPYKLTKNQCEAIKSWEKNAKTKMWLGTTSSALAKLFLQANEQKKLDPEKGTVTEQAIFALCGVTT